MVSRYAINIIENVDQFDTITFTDANSWDFVAYSSGNEYDETYTNVIGRDLRLALNLTSDKDSGAGSLTRIFYSDAYASGSDYFSPTIAFANESILYSNNTGWTTPEQVAFADYFWSTCLTQSGTYGVPEVLAASRGVNNYITNVDENDIILFADAKLFDDLHSADYVGGGVAFTFNNGTTAFVEYGGTFSPTIQLASGESFVYNSRLNEWRTPAQAAADSAIYAAEELTNTYLYGGNDYSVDTFSVTRLTDTYIYDTQYLDNIVFTDGTTAANITSYEAEGDYLTLTFDTGSKMTVEYLTIFSPVFMLSDGATFGYDWFKEFWGYATRLTDNNVSDTEILSGTMNNLVYEAEWQDQIIFADIDASHVTGTSDSGTFFRIDFDNGTTTSIMYDTAAPTVLFGTDIISSDSSGSSGSADLWGDTFTGTAEADNLFVGTHANSIVDNVDSQDSVTFDAALSDIVATSVEGNTIAVAFTSGTTAVIQTAGDSPTFNLASGESYIYDRQAASWKTA